MTVPSSIVVEGFGYYERKAVLYEKTSSDSELVSGRIASKGTADSQAKLYTAGATPIGVFDKQLGKGGYSAVTLGQVTYNDNYAVNGGSVRILSHGPFVFHGCLDDGQSVTKGDRLQPESTTGKLQKQVAGMCVAIALETSAPSGADDDDFLALFVANQMPRIIEETLTASANVITLTHYPTFVEYVDAVTAGVKGGKVIQATSTTPLAGHCYLNRTSKTITFDATTDVVTNATVRYMY